MPGFVLNSRFAKHFFSVNPTNFDFHCHSTVSDGLLPPQEVAQRAAANGVDLWALTDHDDLDGLSIARETAEAAGMRFINGVEISIEWQGLPIHILGLGFDNQNPVLVEALDQLRIGRLERAKRMGDAFAAIGIHGVFEGALSFATNPSLVSRAHFARYLVSIGIAQDVPTVFQMYLRPGKPGYVDHRWASLEDAVSWISAAGGIAVVAHPGGTSCRAAICGAFLTSSKKWAGRAWR
jgi:hypothetical protein